ncbi:MAG: TolC family protein, partial [Lachnospiraceae bacterium]|nr:TolC family protein [Lachnospiraceae bacterium]
MKRKGLNTVKRILCVILSLAIAVNVCSYNDVYTVNAAEKTFPLAMAKNLAMTNSKSCRKLRVQISMKKAKYAESVKKLTLKRKNQSTFRWSPLLSFKFPETPDLVDEFEYAYKPLSIQSEIDKLKHELSDAKYAVYEEVTNLYVNIYTLQEKIAFDEKRLETINDEISSNEAKVVLGLASQSDVDSMKKSQKKLNDKLASEKRDFENKKKDMKTLTKLDVTTGYKFENPYIDISISRANLDDIKQHTLENDNGLYEAKITKDYNLTALNTSYKIMKNWYGSKMSTIDSFVSQARAGQEIDEEAFKNAYDKFMSDADAPWDKEFKLWLIFFTLRFPFEYLKGERSGTRYIENEPYMLYTSCLEYVSSIEEEKNTRIALEKNVDSGFENIVTTRNAYLSLVDEVSDAKKACEKAEYLNSTGKLSYEDYQTEKENYENVEIDMLDALDLYTQTLTSYDRLTCGAITNYLKGTGVQLDTA